MTDFTYNNNDDYIDVRDVIARFEELESALLERFNEQQEIEGDADLSITEPNFHFNVWLSQARADDEEAQEYVDIEKLLNELKGNGGDEQWRGDWYPVTLIRDSYFQESMDDMIADCYQLDALKVPSFIKLTVDYDALQMDYASVEIDGVTYWYR